MTKEEFKQRWERDERGDGITFEDIANCAKEWGLFATPRTQHIDLVRYAVLNTANVEDAEEYAPEAEWLWEPAE